MVIKGWLMVINGCPQNMHVYHPDTVSHHNSSRSHVMEV